MMTWLAWLLAVLLVALPSIGELAGLWSGGTHLASLLGVLFIPFLAERIRRCLPEAPLPRVEGKEAEGQEIS